MRAGLDLRYVQDYFPGIGRYTYNLARALPRAHPDDLFLYVYDPGLPNSRYDLGALAACPNVRLVPIPIPTFSPAEQVRLPLLLGRLGLDLFHSPYYVKPYRLPCPSIVTAQDMIGFRFPQHLPSRWARLAFRLLNRLAVRTAAMVITPSQAAKDDLVRALGTRPSKIAVIRDAADEHFSPQPASSIATVRSKYALLDRYLLYFGINKPHKNLPHLVEAWAMARRRLSGAQAIRLVLAGREDPRYPETRRKVAELELATSVQFVGDVPDQDVPALMSGADVFVFPSLYEGFGLPPLEAMACGCPVIASNASSLPEVVGDAGLLVDPVDVAALADAIVRLLADPALRSDLRVRGQRRAALFSWDTCAEQTHAVYRQVVQT